VNVKEIEKELKKTPNFYGVSSLNDQKNKTSQIELIQSFLLELEKVYEELNRNQIKKTIEEWTKRSSTIGKQVEMNTINGKISGKAIKIDEDGGLIIKDKEKTNKIFAGDIVHL
jgi:BirA family biotin operon repressor/biotin-[acetyl-CoA-carboxylase] ligase